MAMATESEADSEPNKKEVAAEAVVVMVAPHLNGNKVIANRRHESSSTSTSTSTSSIGTEDEHGMVIDSLRVENQELYTQVQDLNRKLVQSFERVSDLEHDLEVSSTASSQLLGRVSRLEAQQTQHARMVDSGELVERWQVRNELSGLMERATAEAAQRGEAESARREIERELEELSASLFGQANRMVVEARMGREASERRLQEAEVALRGAEDAMRGMQTEMQTLIERRQAVSLVTTTTTSTSTSTTGGLTHSHVAYVEYVAFLAHLRQLRSLSPAKTARPTMSTLMQLPFLARLSVEDSDPTLRLELAPALNWLTRRAVQAAVCAGQLSVEPFNHSEPCALCGAATPASADGPGQLYVFKLPETPGSTTTTATMSYYPLCTTGWCLARLRSTCSLWAFVRARIVDKIWDETPAAASPSSTNSTPPLSPTAPPRKRTLWGIASALSERAVSWTTDERGKAFVGLSSVAGKRAAPPPPPPLPKRSGNRTSARRPSPVLRVGIGVEKAGGSNGGAHRPSLDSVLTTEENRSKRESQESATDVAPTPATSVKPDDDDDDAPTSNSTNRIQQQRPHTPAATPTSNANTDTNTNTNTNRPLTPTSHPHTQTQTQMPTPSPSPKPTGITPVAPPSSRPTTPASPVPPPIPKRAAARRRALSTFGAGEYGDANITGAAEKKKVEERERGRGREKAEEEAGGTGDEGFVLLGAAEEKKEGGGGGGVTNASPPPLPVEAEVCEAGEVVPPGVAVARGGGEGREGSHPSPVLNHPSASARTSAESLLLPLRRLPSTPSVRPLPLPPVVPLRRLPPPTRPPPPPPPIPPPAAIESKPEEETQVMQEKQEVAVVVDETPSPSSSTTTTTWGSAVSASPVVVVPLASSSSPEEEGGGGGGDDGGGGEGGEGDGDGDGGGGEVEGGEGKGGAEGGGGDGGEKQQQQQTTTPSPSPPKEEEEEEEQPEESESQTVIREAEEEKRSRSPPSPSPNPSPIPSPVQTSTGTSPTSQANASQTTTTANVMSWEEKTWDEVVRLREDMFWARAGRVVVDV